MDVTFTLNGRDLAPRLSTYDVRKEISYSKVVTTMDGTEHAAAKDRDVITFRLWPFSDETGAADYAVLASGSISATYTDPHTGETRTREVRLASDIDAAFGLRSIDGNRYYKGGDIVLRAVRCG